MLNAAMAQRLQETVEPIAPRSWNTGFPAVTAPPGRDLFVAELGFPDQRANGAGQERRTGLANRTPPVQGSRLRAGPRERIGSPGEWVHHEP